MVEEIHITTGDGESLIDITEQVRRSISDSNIQEGICAIFVPHTTAGITINSCADRLTLADIVSETKRLIPTRVDFHHVLDTPTDAAGHIKSVLVGNSLTLIIKGGELAMGEFQSILFFEFDGPRSRKVMLRVISDNGVRFAR
jgi:secondary thiamine-phosphate synthase enzyme